MVRVMFDIDGSICHCKNHNLDKISKIIAHKKVPWWIVWFGLLITKQEVDKEMIKIFNSPFNEAVISSARPKQIKKYTIKFLRKNGAVILKEEDVNCLGIGKDIVAKKVLSALENKVDIVVDDDEEVLKASAKAGITGCSPRVFKGLYESGVIR